ncbi:hypothetical protein niasHT_007347 [Heterodera trifolii]|uniref:Uncharacterized protein n=1 Tax=Heterodera trifolii TaxID=157864 RepID=A0ABD2LLE7_9BILA
MNTQREDKCAIAAAINRHGNALTLMGTDEEQKAGKFQRVEAEKWVNQHQRKAKEGKHFQMRSHSPGEENSGLQIHSFCNLFFNDSRLHRLHQQRPLRRHVQCLNQRIEVASHRLVEEADVTVAILVEKFRTLGIFVNMINLVRGSELVGIDAGFVISDPENPRKHAFMLGIPSNRLAPNSKSRKWLVSKIDNDAFSKIKQEKFVIDDDYLSTADSSQQNGKYTYTLRTRTFEDADGKKLTQPVETRKQLDWRGHQSYMELRDKNRPSIHKKRVCFVFGNVYFNLDIYIAPPNLPFDEHHTQMILETYTTRPIGDPEPPLPDFLEIEREITMGFNLVHNNPENVADVLIDIYLISL